MNSRLLDSVQPDDEGFFSCPKTACEFQCRRRDALVRHMEKQHPREAGWMPLVVERDAINASLRELANWFEQTNPADLPSKIVELLRQTKAKATGVLGSILAADMLRILHLQHLQTMLDTALSEKLAKENDLTALPYGELKGLLKTLHQQDMGTREAVESTLKQQSEVEDPIRKLTSFIRTNVITGEGNDQKLLPLPENASERGLLIDLLKDYAKSLDNKGDDE